MPAPDSVPTWTDAVQGYRLLMRQRLASAVDAQHHSPTAMLLDCRQAVEALLLALASVRMQRAEHNSRAEGRSVEDLESLLHRVRARTGDAQEPPAGAALLSDDALAHIETLRTQANRVVHIRSFRAGDPWDFVMASRASLAGLLRWAFSESAIAYARVPASPAEQALPAWDALLAALSAPIQRTDSPAELLRQRDAALAALTDAHAATREALAAREAELKSLRAPLAHIEAAHEKERDALRKQLALVETAHQKERDTLRKQLALAEQRARAASPGCFGQLARGAGFALGTGLLLAIGAAALLDGPVRTWLADLQVDGDTHPAPVAAALATPDPPPADPPPADPPPPTPATCPTGMVRVDGGEVHLGQPEGGRTDWPRATRKSLAPVEVPAFCVMPAAVTWGALAAAEDRALSDVAAGACRGDAIAQDRGDADDPAGCLINDQVLAYCRATFGPAARPPRIVEWEWLHASRPTGVELSRPRDEWAADSFPPVAFARAETDLGVPGLFRAPLRAQSAPPKGAHARWSWNRVLGEPRWTLGFRCALPLGP